MKTHELLLVVLLSIGALQGLIYSIILWRNQGANKTANKFLSVILFFFAYRLFVEILKFYHIGYYDIWYHLLLEYNWVYGALIFFFVKAYITPNFELNFKKDWIHFLPVGIEFLWSNFIKSQNFYWDGSRESLSWLGYYGYIIWMHYPTMYIVSALLIILYTGKAKTLLNSNTNVILIQSKTKWLSRVLSVLQIFSVFIILVVLIDLFFYDYAFNRWYHVPMFIGMTLITYWLGVEGYNRRNDIVIKIKNTLSNKEQIQLNAIAEQLVDLMENKQVFKNSNITLASLSDLLEVKSYITTKCLNAVFEQKFSDFINGYRIKELKRLLQDPENEKYTLLSLAYDVGFNSKASFNRAVKKITGGSPSQLKSKL